MIAQTESKVVVGDLIATRGKYQLILSSSEIQGDDVLIKTLYQYDFEWVEPESMDDPISIKMALLDTMRNIHDRMILEGYPTSFGFRVDIAEKNVTDWSSALQLLQLSGASEIDVCDYDNKIHTLSAEQFIQMCGEIGAYLMALRSKKWANREAVISSENVKNAAVIAASWNL